MNDHQIAVAYLARGADEDWIASCERFIQSYQTYSSGINHCLYVLFKGFQNEADLQLAKDFFQEISYVPIDLSDDDLDIGAYIAWAKLVTEEKICILNTSSEILTHNWLYKLAVNLSLPNVGLVGASASYESLNELDGSFPMFPNDHIRSNGFMIDRSLFCQLTKGLEIKNKLDAYHFESGPNSLTQRIKAMGKSALLVGKNGRGYALENWPKSDTFRQGNQVNLLLADNRTRHFSTRTWVEKKEFVTRTWGYFIKT